MTDSQQAPPKWSSQQLETERLLAIEVFRQKRMQEPLEEYLDAFDIARGATETLLEMTVDFSELEDNAVDVLSDKALLEAVRYLPGPPISKDDLTTLLDDAQSDKRPSLAPSRIRADPELAKRIVQTVLLGLDRNRFPWVGEDREPSEAERAAAAMATAALIASRRVMTNRANVAKSEQEAAVKARLVAAGFEEIPSRTMNNLADAPKAGEFCSESRFGSRKADVIAGLWDNRVMPIECKVSNSSTNSVKRLNNDAAVKAGTWKDEFGKNNVVPTALLAGVFKRHNLEQAQDAGLVIFWAHKLNALVEFVESTKP